MCGHRLTPPRGESPLPLPFHLPPCPGPVKGRQALPLADGSGTSQRTELAEQLGKPSQEQQPGPAAPEAWAVTSHAGGHGTRCRAGPRPATSPARGCGMRRAPPTLRTRGRRLLRPAHGPLRACESLCLTGPASAPCVNSLAVGAASTPALSSQHEAFRLFVSGHFYTPKDY